MNEQHRLHKEKIEQAIAYMNDLEIGCWLIRNRGGGDPSVPLLFGAVPVADTVYVITPDRTIAIVDPQDEERTVETMLFDEVTVYGENGLGAAVERAIRALDPQRIALNISKHNHLADGLTVGGYRSLMKMLGEPYRERVVSSESFIQKLRSIKSAQEVAYIREAIAITLAIYDEVFAKVRKGMTEIEVGRLFVDAMNSRGVVNGITRRPTPPIVMKHKIAHRAPGDGVIEEGDYLIIDFSVDYMGYCSDIARTAYVLRKGETRASEAMQAAFTAVREATDLAAAALKPGAIGRDVDYAARRHLLDKGYPDIFHSVGHQVGRDVHDGGTILGPERKGYKRAALGAVEEGMVFAIEPTILYEEGPAIISEDNYLVTAEGAVLLGEPQKELVLIG